MADPLARLLLVQHPLAAARILERYPAEESASMFEGLAEEAAAELLAHMPPQAAARIVHLLPERQRLDVFRRIQSGLAAQIAARMPQPEIDAILQAIPLMHSTSIRNAMRQPPGTAGSIMRTDVLTLGAALSAAEARDLARAATHALQPVLFVVDGLRHPTGVVDVADLWVAGEATPIARLARPCPRPVAARMKLGLVLRESAWTTAACLPVIDADGSMLGVIAQGDLLRVAFDRRGAAPSGSATLTDAAMAFGELVWSVGAAAIEQAGGDRR
jgi:magnesium transporter